MFWHASRVFWHASARIAVWHVASLAHILSFLFSDEYDWLNVLWRHWLRFVWLFKGFSSQRKSEKNPFTLDSPGSQPTLSRFWSGKKQYLFQAVYFNMSTGIFWPNYPFKNPLPISSMVWYYSPVALNKHWKLNLTQCFSENKMCYVLPCSSSCQSKLIQVEKLNRPPSNEGYIKCRPPSNGGNIKFRNF